MKIEVELKLLSVFIWVSEGNGGSAGFFCAARKMTGRKINKKCIVLRS